MDLPVGELLKKFGAGEHKPGSGSASALQGMVAAQMLRTVIDLTSDPKRGSTYFEILPQLLIIKQNIESRLFPGLEELFQQDSDEFDKVIKLRRQRDRERDAKKRKKLQNDCTAALRVATDLPLRIAEICEEIGNSSIYVFQYGFKSARGDSGVALNSAIAAIGSCLAIIDLNLTTLPFDNWMEEITPRIAKLRSRYELLTNKGAEVLRFLQKEAEDNVAYQKSIADFRRGNLADKIKSNSEIEGIVRQLQNLLWVQKEKIWKNNIPNIPLGVLKPEVALKKVMDYSFITSNSLGFHFIEGNRYEVAGMINKKEKSVQISSNFSPETQNFTAAHELGHAILHHQIVLHRDKPMDWSVKQSKNREEIQADKFAVYFLMPANLVEEAFRQIFGTERFVINEESVLAIKGKSIKLFRKKCKDIRGLARELASTQYYRDKTFYSLSTIFNVSVETMAIRLEELNLLRY